MDKSQQILSDIVVFQKYAKFDPIVSRRETWEELCYRNMQMHIKKYPELTQEIKQVYKDFVLPRKVLPSMRSMQFAGNPIELSNNRIFNCAFTNVDDLAVFSETMFNLLSGSGVGYSVQKQHVDKLPVIKGVGAKTRRFLISDNIEGWAEAVKNLVRSYAQGKSDPVFDYRDIRAKGSTLVTSGGKAPGPDPLRICLDKIRSVLNATVGRKLKPIECHDILCHIADAVLAGGIRRAACISLFSKEDLDMLYCKTGAWWELNPQRGRANNSVALERGNVTEEEWNTIWDVVKNSGAGEPGFVWLEDSDSGVNPCCFTADMKLLTDEGYVPFGDLVKKESVTIVNPNGNTTKGVVWSSGEKEIVSIKLSNGKVVSCTPDHIFLADGFVETRADEMKGKRVTPNYFVKTEPENVKDFKAGFIFGDGALGRLNSENHQGLEVFIGVKDVDVEPYFGTPKKGMVYSTEAKNLAIEYQLPPVSTFDRYLPSINISSDFMMGLYSANGSVIKSGKRVSLKTTSLKLAQQVKEWLVAEGMTPYITVNKPTSVKFSNGEYTCKQSYDVNLCGLENLTKFSKNISFIHTYKQKALEQAILDSAPKVMSIKNAGRAEVFDFTEPETHWGIVEGCVVHNSEIGLRSNQFCNLTEVNASDVFTQEELNARVKAGAFIGTLQAGYTDFHYLRDIWKNNSEEESLIGVGMTGIASGGVLKLDLVEAANEVNKENQRVAKLIGINPAARTTCIKPSGSTSCVAGSSSGIHAWHNDYYIRRVRVGKQESLYDYLINNLPELVEDCVFKPHIEAVVSLPQKAPDGAILRDESVIDLLERVKKFNLEWVKTGHNSGKQHHNVSCTISIKEDEWNDVGNWLWENRNNYTGVSVLPYSDHTYKQAPFEDCSKEVFDAMFELLKDIDLSQVIEKEDNTNLTDQAACSGGACEIK